MKFVAYELRKLAGARFLRVMLILMLIANMLLCNATVKENGIDGKIVAELFALYRDNPAAIEEGYAELIALQNEQNAAFQKARREGNYNYEPSPIPNKLALADRAGVSDAVLYRELFSRIEQIENYPVAMQRVIDLAKANLAEFGAMGISETSYTYRYQEQLISRYEQLRDKVTIELENTHGWDKYFDYTAVNVFLFAFLVLCGTMLFSQERSAGILPILRTSERGRVDTALAKIAAMVIVTIAVVLLFSLTTFAVVGLKFGYSSPTNALQAFDRFTYSPYILSVGEYFAVTLAVKSAAFLLFGALTLLLGQLISNAILAYACGLGFFGVNFLLYTLSYLNADNPFKNLNLVAVAAVNPLFLRYRSINLFGAVVGYVPFMVCLFAALFLLLSLLTLRCSALSANAVGGAAMPFQKQSLEALRAKLTARLPIGSRKARPLRLRSRSLFAAECRKTLLSSRLLALVLLLLIAKCALANERYTPRSTYSDAVYHEYMTVLAGPVTEEKRTYIAEERKHIDSILASYASQQQTYFSEEISFEAYSAYLDDYNYAYGRNSIFAAIEGQLVYLDRLAEKGIEASFVYATGWNQLFSSPFDFPLFVLLLLLFAGSFAVEYDGKSSSGGFSAILRSTGRGRGDTFAAKLLSCMTISSLAALLMNAIDLFFIARAYPLPELNAPLQSLTLFADCNASLSILEALLLVYALRILAAITLAVALSAFSCLTARALPAVSLTAALTLFPAIFDYFGLPLFDHLDYTAYLRATPLLLLSTAQDGSFGFLALFAGCATILAALLTAVAAKRWNR